VILVFAIVIMIGVLNILTCQKVLKNIGRSTLKPVGS
jgi:hypothetical protein